MENSYNYKQAKEAYQIFYRSINSVFSPVLQERVVFSSEGVNHIIFKNSRSEREKSSQILRFKLLPLAKILVSISTTY